MKKLSILLVLWNVAFAASIQNRKIDSDSLAKLALTLGISEEENVVKETQKRWLRKSGQERWELSEIEKEKRSFVLNWAKEQGFFDPWMPALAVYDKALILGATTSRMQSRLDFLKELWIQGVRFNEIVWLTGDRLLDERVDGLIKRCNSESEAAHILWEEGDIPVEMRMLSIHFVAVPMKENGERPNTADTIVSWLNTSPNPCKALFVSDQPFCGYQFSVIKGILPDAFLFDVVGQGVDPYRHPASAAIVLDSVARWIYRDSLGEKG